MSKNQPGVEPAIEGKSKQATVTNWGVFDQSQLVPTEIVCQDYRPVHVSDNSCHTRLKLEAENVLRHMSPEHISGGGFRFTLRRSDGKTWQGWKDLQDAGVEIHDFRCEVCDEQIPINGRRILKHLQPHAGKIRKIRPGGEFNLTLRVGEAPEPGDNEEF